MAFSMTGFGRYEIVTEEYKLFVEIRTVNNRYLDISLKIPRNMNIFEEAIRKEIKKYLRRGRVELYLHFTDLSGDQITIEPNYAVIDEYMSAFDKIKSTYDLEGSVSLDLIKSIQDTLIIDYAKLDKEKVWSIISIGINEALTSVRDMRKVEGEKLVEDILLHLKETEDIASKIEDKAVENKSEFKENLLNKINDILVNIEVDETRLMQEVAYLIDKYDISEEIARLYSHFIQFKKIIHSDDVIGRKLDFLVQEINREINTIGSKSPNTDISNYVVELKSLFEKIREQIQNIE